MQNVTRLYDNYRDAQAAVAALEAAGIPSSDLSIVANNSDNWHDGSGRRPIIDRDGDGRDDRAEGAEAGAAIGAGVGGAAGLLAGLGILAIPGLGPVVAAGWLASTALGVVAGGATGGIVGGLSQAGMSSDDANFYAEGVRRGGTLVTARVNDGDVARVESILERNGVDVETRRADYRASGWNQFDPNAAPYTSDQVKAERDRFLR